MDKNPPKKRVTKNEFKKENSEKLEKTEKTEKTEKPDKPDQTEKTEKTEKPRRKKPFDPIDAVLTKYTEMGWNAMRMKNSINDIVASKPKNTKIHFILVVTPDTLNDPRFNGLPKNTFIQNAFSNGAVPIFATVTTKQVGSGEKARLDVKITFEDVNSNARVIIAKKADGEKPEK